MTVRHPARPLPRASEGQGGASILALLDTIPLPRALPALLNPRLDVPRDPVSEITNRPRRAYSQSGAATGQPRNMPADARSDVKEGGHALSFDGGLAVQAFFDFLGRLNQDQRLSAFWCQTRRRCVASAFVSAFLHEQGGDPKRLSLAFSAGLLHDIGAPALAAVVPRSYQRLLEDSERIGRPLCEVERTLLATDHAAAGAHLLLRWGACRQIQDCARMHHMPWHAFAATGEEVSLERLVMVADAIVAVADGVGVLSDDGLHWLEGGALPGVTAKVVDEAVEFARTRLSELSASARHGGGGGDVPLVDSNMLGGSSEDRGATSSVNPCPADVKERADWGQATRQLLRSAPEFCFITDVCQAAAGHLAQVVGLASCVVVVEDAAHSVCAGASAVTGGRGKSFRSRLDHAFSGAGQSRFHAYAAARESAMGARLASAGDEHVRIWRRCGLEGAAQPLWIRSWVWAEDLHVLAVFEAGSDQIASFEARLLPDGPFATVVEAMFRLVARQEEDRQRLDSMLEAARLAGAHARGEVWSQSVSMISEVAAGAAHEINNPLAVISGRAQMELARAADPRLSKSLQSIVEQADRTSGIILDLVEFAKPSAPDPALFRADELVVPALQHWQARSGLAAHQVRLGVFDPELTVKVDTDHFHQIIVALLENAASAMDSKSAALHINSPSRPSDEQIRIVIEDNGAGMDARVLAHAMVPFFSNRTAGRGRGFGLSRAVRLAEVNGGRLWLESSPSVGTRAIVALPAR